MRCPDYRLIPVHLIENVKALGWSVEKFNQYQELLKGREENILLCILDNKEKESVIRGFLWAQVDEMKEAIVIHAYSVEPNLQDGNLVPFCQRFMEMIMRKSQGKVKNIYWFTDRPKAYEKHGMTRSKYSLMCLNEER